MMEYAIVDIETTGGYAAGSGITEIAVLIHDGKEVTDRFESLVNPGRPIPLAIQLLTGINDDMVAYSPSFADLAPRLWQLLEGRVFVAHNVNFDYSFIRHHFELCGKVYTAPKLCTVRLSRKLRPELKSYSLGRLCDALQIPVTTLHRAGADAAATAELFGRLLQWDTEGAVAAMLKVKSKDQVLPPNLAREDFDALPSAPGVYYFLDQYGKAVYVGKAADLKKRVATHFTGNNPLPQRQHFLRTIHNIRFERCGTELMALLLEAQEIKKHWPAFNRAQKNREPKFGLYRYEDQNGYMRLAVGKYAGNQLAEHVFGREVEARNMLYKLVRNFNLCPQFCSLQHDLFDLGLMEGNITTCACQHSTDEYNARVHTALEQFRKDLPSFILIDRGRHACEQSCVWVEQGNLYGMGYIDQEAQLHTPADIKTLLQPVAGNSYMLQLVLNYAAKYPAKVRPLRVGEAVDGLSYPG
jgi:DNA polymerase-3 subunit epsilon